MKVLIIIPNLCVGGAEKHVLKLIKEFNKVDNDFRLLVLSDDITLNYDFIPDDKFFVLKGSFLNKISSSRQILRDFKPDLVHSFLYKANLFSLLLFGHTHVWSIRNDKPFLKFLHLYRAFWFVFAHFFPIKLLFVSNSSYKSHSKYFFKKIDYKIIRNGINSNYNLLKKKNICKGHLNIVLVGRNTFEKNFQPLINFINEQQGLSSFCRFHFIGRGCLDLENLSENVFLYDESSSLESFYHDKDIMLINSISEGFPNVFLEALVNNIVVFSRDVSDVKLFIDDFHIYDNYYDLFYKLKLLFESNLYDYINHLPDELSYNYMINEYRKCYTNFLK